MLMCDVKVRGGVDQFITAPDANRAIRAIECYIAPVVHRVPLRSGRSDALLAGSNALVERDDIRLARVVAEHRDVVTQTAADSRDVVLAGRARV